MQKWSYSQVSTSRILHIEDGMIVREEILNPLDSVPDPGITATMSTGVPRPDKISK